MSVLNIEPSVLNPSVSASLQVKVHRLSADPSFQMDDTPSPDETDYEEVGNPLFEVFRAIFMFLLFGGERWFGRRFWVLSFFRFCQKLVNNYFWFLSRYSNVLRAFVIGDTDTRFSVLPPCWYGK